jgi:hypothetical protein
VKFPSRKSMEVFEMDFLEPEFEESIVAKLDEKTNDVIIGSQRLSPVDFLRSDGAAYSEEFNLWLEKEWIPIRKATLNRILKYHNTNKQRFEQLCTLAKDQKMIPFIGAGMSIPSGMPSWTSFLTDLCNYADAGFNKQEFDNFLQTGQYEEAATSLFDHIPLPLFNERFENTYRLPKNRNIEGTIRFLPMTFSSIVITTNFDNILEKIFMSQNLEFHAVLEGPEIAKYRGCKDETKRFLLKIHGDHKDTNKRVLTKDEYENFYSSTAAAKEELALIFRTHPVIFLGCSLNNDRTLTLLKNVFDADPRIPKHFTFIPKPVEEAKWREREHFLTQHNIFPIWFENDHDQSIEALFTGMMRELEII